MSVLILHFHTVFTDNNQLLVLISINDLSWIMAIASEQDHISPRSPTKSGDLFCNIDNICIFWIHQSKGIRTTDNVKSFLSKL